LRSQGLQNEAQFFMALVFNNTCHTTRDSDNRVGPHLHNIIGRKAGSLPDYRYSDALVSGNGMKPYTGCGRPRIGRRSLRS
jgi:cytochrome c2